jgi:hypothetical protein
MKSKDETLYFRRIAVQSYRRAGSVTERHIDYEALMRRGHEFKARAATAVARLVRMRAGQYEAEREVRYRDSREHQLGRFL